MKTKRFLVRQFFKLPNVLDVGNHDSKLLSTMSTKEITLQVILSFCKMPVKEGNGLSDPVTIKRTLQLTNYQKIFLANDKSIIYDYISTKMGNKKQKTFQDNRKKVANNSRRSVITRYMYDNSACVSRSTDFSNSTFITTWMRLIFCPIMSSRIK